MELLNLDKSQTIHQRCVLVKGRCENESATYLTITTNDPYGYQVFPDQTWPIAGKEFRALLFLVAGENILQFTADTGETVEASANYIPLTSVPPIHLAILVCKDSPLMMDCSPARGGGISTAHSNLDAAIAKLRMTAYMWMALTAEEMRLKGLDRRSFRLEEEWTADTVSSNHVNSKLDNTLHTGIMQTTAKVHIIRTEKTVEELRRGNTDVPTIFEEAVSMYGMPLSPAAHPTVVFMVLDSHYSKEKGQLANNRHGVYKPSEISYAYFGSTPVHAFPSYVEEVVSCLRDTRRPIPNGRAIDHPLPPPGIPVPVPLDLDDTMWSRCAQGQMSLACLCDAFGASSPNVPEALWSTPSDWARCFLPPGLVLGDKYPPKPWLEEEINEAREKDDTDQNGFFTHRRLLRFHVQPHFRLPHEKTMPLESLEIKPTIRVDADFEAGDVKIKIECSVGICRLVFRDSQIESTPTLKEPLTTISFSAEELTDRFTRKVPLKIEAIAVNGHSAVADNAWKLIDLLDFIKIPGTDVKLMRRSVASPDYMASKLRHSEAHGIRDQIPPPAYHRGGDFSIYYRWNVLLSKRLENGTIIRATSVAIHVGACFDGAVVKYANNEEINCAPRFEQNGNPFQVGGTRNTCRLDPGDEIARVEVVRNGASLGGVRIITANGHRGGRANGHGNESLEPPEGHKIIGLYGAWSGPYYTHEFGIITAPRDFVLPPEAYDLDQLNNRDPNDPNRPGAQNERNGDRGPRNDNGGGEARDDNSDAQSMGYGVELEAEEDDDEDMNDDADNDEDEDEDREEDEGNARNADQQNPYLDPELPATGDVENVLVVNGAVG